MEVALMRMFEPRVNLVVPNISWGLWIHECDLLVLTKAGYAYEIEIKVSRADLIKDKEKNHQHFDTRIKFLYFAIPEHLKKDIEHIPERAGIIIVKKVQSERLDLKTRKWIECEYLVCDVLRKPEKNSGYKFTEEERYQVARLGTMRILGLKQKILKLKLKD